MLNILIIDRGFGEVLCCHLFDYILPFMCNKHSFLHLSRICSSQSTLIYKGLFRIDLGNNSMRQVKGRSSIIILILKLGKLSVKKVERLV